MLRTFAVIGLVIALGLGLLYYAIPTGEKAGEKMRVGVPDDLSGLIIHYMVREKGLSSTSIRNSLETLALKDCCSSTTQWALSSGDLDIAIMCPDAAAALVEKDARYQIVSECTVNTDIIVLRPGANPNTIGIAHNRTYQADIVRTLLGCEPVNILSAGIPYAYEKQAVDGVVVDALKGLALPGERRPSFDGNVNRLTSVLVARKDFISDPRYTYFIGLYREAVNELNCPDILRAQIRSIKGLEIKQEDWELWNRFRIRFRCTIAEVPGE